FHTPYSFLFNDTATSQIYTLSLHDALPISFTVMVRQSSGHTSMHASHSMHSWSVKCVCTSQLRQRSASRHVRSRSKPSSASTSIDRKSTRLNSSHVKISYAVFCLKKKKKEK